MPEELMIGSRLSCRIDSAQVSSTLHLADGRSLEGTGHQLVVNRLVSLPAVRSSSPADTAYLGEEWRAAATAWLRSLPGPVLNPPRAASLVGPVLADPVWRTVAAAYGLPVQAWRAECEPAEQDDADTAAELVEVACVDGHCIDPTGRFPEEWRRPLAAVSRHVGAPLLGARFDAGGDGGWRFCGATPLPRLAAGGDALVDAVLACAARAADLP